MVIDENSRFNTKEYAWLISLEKSTDVDLLEETKQNYKEIHILELQSFCNKLFIEKRNISTELTRIEELMEKTNGENLTLINSLKDLLEKYKCEIEDKDKQLEKDKEILTGISIIASNSDMPLSSRIRRIKNLLNAEEQIEEQSEKEKITIEEA